MHFRSYTSEGVILSVRDFGEADRIVSIFSEEYGKKSFLAKGVRKISSRKRGHIKPFNHINFSAVTGNGMDIITETVSVGEFEGVTSSLGKISLAFYVCEIIGKISNEAEPSREVFDHLISTLHLIESSKKLKEIRVDFVTGLLQILGYAPKNKLLSDPFSLLENVIEKQLYSERVGKRMLQ